MGVTHDQSSSGLMLSSECVVCDDGRHVQRSDGTYHSVDGLLVRVGSLTELRMIQRRDEHEVTTKRKFLGP